MKVAKSKFVSDSKLSMRQGGARKGRGKAKKDPNKQEASQEEFRQEFKEKNPNNSRAVSVVGGGKWSSMTAEEKTPYVAKAETRKTECVKAMRAYNKLEVDVNESEKPKAVVEEVQPDKSVSEVEDDEGSDEDD